MCNNGERVLLGIDRVCEPEFRGLFENKRLGVVSAASGIASDYRFPIDVLNESYNVTALYAPEHGPRGVLGPGEKVGDSTDIYTGIHVYSMYADVFTSRRSTDADSPCIPGDDILGNIDVMVFDMQDVGSRYFTYVSSMFCCMRVCADNGLPFVVLDRPNPLGGYVEGNVLDPAFSSFIGLTEVPIRHGMTAAELARFYNGKYSLHCDLHIVPMKGWRRDMYYDDTGLPFVRPSPNLPTLESVYVYNGTCLFEGTNVSVGRGTAVPFTTIGAEYINPLELAAALNSDGSIHGVRFSPAFFRPMYSKLEGKSLYGVTLHVTDKRALEPVRLGVTMLRTIEALYPEFEYSAPSNPANRWHIDLAAGGNGLRLSGKPADLLMKEWNAQAEAFGRENRRYLLY